MTTPTPAPALIPPTTPPYRIIGCFADDQAPSPLTSRLAAALTLGFSAAIATWIAWFLLHMPATAGLLSESITGPLLLAVGAAVILFRLLSLPTADRLPVGPLAGAISGLVTLLILPSKLIKPQSSDPASVQPGLDALTPSIGLWMAGFVIAMTIAGLVAAFGALSMGGNRPRRSARQWLASFALVNAIAILPLLTLGGLVTSARAGFAVPDWPGTYGANMFLYPIGLMSDPRIFLEHTHRLFGTLVGLTTITTFIFALCCAPRPIHKLAALGLLVLVILQGLMGGLWVEEKHRWMVILHGVLGQVYFALTCAFAASLSPRFRAWAADPVRHTVKRPSRLTTIYLVALFLQLVMGTMTRHSGSKGMHALFTHIGLSLAVLVMAILCGIALMRLRKLHDSAAWRTGHGKGLWLAGHNVLLATTLQFALGWLALFAWMSAKDAPAPTADQLSTAAQLNPWEVLSRTVHQANGALVMGASAVMALWTSRR